MDTDRLIARLGSAERLPTGVIQACLSNRDEVVPDFLDLLHRCADDVPISSLEENAIFFIVHMLGELKEKRAFKPLVDFLTSDQERIDRVLGDAISQNLPQILISTFDGETKHLYGIMNNPGLDEFVRDAAFRAWTYLVSMGDIDRDEAHQYLLEAFETIEPRERSYVWVSWVDAVSRLGFEDMRHFVEQTFAKGRIPHRVLDVCNFEDELAAALTANDRVAWLRENHLHPFEDTVGVLSRWYGFSEDYIRKKREYEREALLSDTVTNPYRSVGRNDPCPCGSGKKFKHCCLH